MYWMLKIYLSFMIFYGTILSHDWPPGRFNAAFNKTTYQSSDYYKDFGFSDSAVDGDHNTDLNAKSCTHTQLTEHTWWAVDLGLQYYIYSVTLTNILSYHQHVNDRLQNFTISGSNTSYIAGSGDAVLCAFQLEPMGKNETKTFTCAEPFSALYVVIDKATPVFNLMPLTLIKKVKEAIVKCKFLPLTKLTLCEVEVEAKCLDGFYGEHCSEICPENCAVDSYCNVVDGTCSEECKSGFTSNRCDQVCPDGTYGGRCSGNCSDNCHSPGCDKFDDTGKCLSGCITGYYSDHCNTTCAIGSYGEGCQYNCSVNCLEDCDTITGSCNDKCQAGFKGDMCNTTCMSGTYGANCLLSCSVNCAGTCDIYHGNCFSGCMEGYTGDRCDKSCDLGYYGKNCTSSCQNCLSACDQISGSCSQDCSVGFVGIGCNIPCSPGYYGLGCAHQCENSCQDVCDHVTGACECEDGYSGFKCDIVISEENGNIIMWVVVPVCITVAVVSAIIGLVVCKVMRNKRTVDTKTNDHALKTRNNDVTDSPMDVPDYIDVIPSAVRDNPGLSHSTSEAEPYEVLRTYVNVDNSQTDLNVYDSILD